VGLPMRRVAIRWTLGTGLTLAGVCQMAGTASAQSPMDQINGDQLIATCLKTSGARRVYIKGMALMFARAVCHSDRPETVVATGKATEPRSKNNKSDGLSVYEERFQQLGMTNDTNGLDTLRHTYVLLTGLGLVESSGKYCMGRYGKQNFSTAESAEAGLFQTSWGAHKSGNSLEPLFRKYQKDSKGCLLDVFGSNVTCKPWDAKNWGSPSSDGYAWQELTKHCPAFAVEYASVVIRRNGGAAGEFGPIKCFAGTQKKPCQPVQLYPACDTMFSKIQSAAKDDPQVCASLP
jgi:hypothetical protein